MAFIRLLALFSLLTVAANGILLSDGTLLGDGAGFDPHGSNASTDDGRGIDPNG